MKYRRNQRTGDELSIIGLGTSYIGAEDEETAVAALRYAYENGINYADLATADAKTFEYYRKALGDVREKMHYQVHFGADYTTGQYGWTTSLEKVKQQVKWMLETLDTDYIDYGMIHCLDEENDWQAYQENGVLDYLLEMKKQGIVRHIGFSTHTPELANQVLDTGLVDQMMFSINPGYDYQEGTYANGTTEERMDLYRRCEKEGIGITVMKPFSGGQMLQADQSPFHQALTTYQCLQYALDKPGVLVVVPGIRNVEEVKNLLGFLEASEEERDYSVLGTFTAEKTQGKCVYCNHCAPCPMGLNVALINKYYDLAKAGDDMAADHYRTLEHKASECVGCGHCDHRCPFHVHQSERMQEIQAYFGE